jgi:tetratricopeptide (TPR) repeat protein
VDSAAALLWNPTVTAAVTDSMPLARRHKYPWHHESLWLNGRFDGWHWYVARARAEVAGSLGRWNDALAAARQCAVARENSGKDWLLLALCAGRTGAWDEAAAAEHRAETLDPTLPEAFYLRGLLEWRAARRASAREAFGRAIGLDSTYREAALAAARTRLPVPPDTLPIRFLTGRREAGMLTSAARPKPEEYVQMDRPPEFVRGAQAVVPDSLKTGWEQIQMSPLVLVDERGLIVLNELSWGRGSKVPDAMIGLMLSSLPHWLHHPGMRMGRPYPMWVSIDLDYSP